jgi:predicted MFS family arabinose efflux permease
MPHSVPAQPTKPSFSAGHAVAIFGVFALAYWLSYALRAINAVLGVPLQTELGVDSAQLGFLSSMYFLTFASMQLPLGMLLDRFGPRRVETLLLAIAAAGCIAFAWAQSFTTLCVARAAIGVGVSACLMAPYKGYRLWFAESWQAPLSSWMLMVGTAGALTATIPVEWAMASLGWRGIFCLIAALLALAGLLQWWVLPRPPAAHTHLAPAPETLAVQWAGFLQILRGQTFWRYAPPAIVIHGGFMAIQGLWAGPWMREVEGKNGAETAHALFVMGIGLLISYFCLAWVSRWMVRHHLPLSRAMAIGMALSLVFLSGIIFPPVPLSSFAQLVLWVAYAVSASIMSFGYTAINMSFPAHLTGRTSTALNFMIFLGAFLLQWGLGAALEVFKTNGVALTQAYRYSFAGLLALQTLALLWFIVQPRYLQSQARGQ